MTVDYIECYLPTPNPQIFQKSVNWACIEKQVICT